MNAKKGRETTASGLIATVEEPEARIVRFGERPIDFETFLDLNVHNDMELVGGVMVKKMAAQLEHEKLLAWLNWLWYGYVRQKNLGISLGSRTSVEINEFHSRMPDAVFVRQENTAIVQQRAIYGTPELAIELILPNDRPSSVTEVETDYRAIGVPEIIFIDQQKIRVRLLRKRGATYEETILTTGELRLATIPGFVLRIAWLFADPRPDELNILNFLLAA